MKFFIDTADVKEIAAANALGLVDGVTTNPSLVAKSGRDFHEIEEIFPAASYQYVLYGMGFEPKPDLHRRLCESRRCLRAL